MKKLAIIAIIILFTTIILPLVIVFVMDKAIDNSAQGGADAVENTDEAAADGASGADNGAASDDNG